MASTQHGKTVVGQGVFSTVTGKQAIPRLDITTFQIGNPPSKIRFPSQTAAANGTARIPQDLTSFIAANTITQKMLDDPNSLLRDHIASQNIIATTTISISTQQPAPMFGGGTPNIAFLQGDPALGPNAQTVLMTATFWIETVEITILVPPFSAARAAQTNPRRSRHPGRLAPRILLHPPIPIPKPRPIKIRVNQIHYSHTGFLNLAP